MARLLIVEPEDYFHTLFQAVLAQAGYVAVEAANSYEGQLVVDAVCRSDVMRDIREPALAHLLIVEAEAQFHAFFCGVLAQEGYVVTEASAAELAAADAAGLEDVRRDLRYLVVY
jgi:DNA-binding response OmpR family regulator